MGFGVDRGKYLRLRAPMHRKPKPDQHLCLQRSKQSPPSSAWPDRPDFPARVGCLVHLSALEGKGLSPDFSVAEETRLTSSGQAAKKERKGNKQVWWTYWVSCKPQTGFPGGSEVKNLPTDAGGTGDAGLISGSGRSPGEGNGSPLQYSCPENPMDIGAWWAAVHGVPKSWTQLSMHAYKSQRGGTRNENPKWLFL